MMKKRMPAVLAVLMIFCVFLTGCESASNGNPTQEQQNGISASPSDNTPYPSSEVDSGRAKDTLSSIDKNATASLTITGMNLDDLDYIIHQFNSEYPNVVINKDDINTITQLSENVKVSSGIAEAKAKLNTKILSGQAGDIVLSVNSVSLFKQNFLSDLREFIYSDPQFNKDDYFMNIIEAYSYNGGLYLMPLDNSVKMLGFNEPLTGGYSFTDKNDVWELTRALDEAKRVVDQNGLKGKNYINFTPDSHLFSTLLTLNCTEFVNLETGKVNIDCAEFIDMLKYIKRLADEGYISSSERSGNMPEGLTVINFGDTGRAAAMLFTCTKDKPDYLSISPVTNKNGDLSILGVKTLSINEHSVNKRLAWEFIKCALSYEAQSSPDMTYPPINRAALRVYAEQRYLLAQSNIAQRNDTMKTTDYSMPDAAEGVRLYEELLTSLNDRVTKYTFTDFEIGEIISEQVADYFEGKVSADETARILQRKISMMIEG